MSVAITILLSVPPAIAIMYGGLRECLRPRPTDPVFNRPSLGYLAGFNPRFLQ